MITDARRVPERREPQTYYVPPLRKLLLGITLVPGERLLLGILSFSCSFSSTLTRPSKFILPTKQEGSQRLKNISYICSYG
jgi:hypothetical protein